MFYTPYRICVLERRYATRAEVALDRVFRPGTFVVGVGPPDPQVSARLTWNLDPRNPDGNASRGAIEAALLSALRRRAQPWSRGRLPSTRSARWPFGQFAIEPALRELRRRSRATRESGSP